jgi:hypothetical protein
MDDDDDTLVSGSGLGYRFNKVSEFHYRYRKAKLGSRQNM